LVIRSPISLLPAPSVTTCPTTFSLFQAHPLIVPPSPGGSPWAVFHLRDLHLFPWPVTIFCLVLTELTF
jgi:hypothetical protein